MSQVTTTNEGQAQVKQRVHHFSVLSRTHVVTEVMSSVGVRFSHETEDQEAKAETHSKDNTVSASHTHISIRVIVL